MTRQAIKVMIVEDSPSQLILLEAIINDDPRLQVVATARTAEQAIRLLTRIRPDVVSMDIHLPKMDGFEATKKIMEAQPLPIVVVSSSVSTREAEISMDSLRAGALAVVQKPPGPGNPRHKELASKLCDQLAIMSEVKVVRQRGRREAPTHKRPAENTRDIPPQSPAMVGIVASTGGPPALARILENLPACYPTPILVVQHMSSDFLPGFVEWLAGKCNLDVKLAAGGEKPGAGIVYVAPGDHHLTLTSTGLHLSKRPPLSFQRPSGDLLLQSLAEVLGAKAIGILLTGMGEDGAKGLLAIRKCGGHTIVEHRSTAVVYGMPAAAIELGAARESLPLQEIASRLQSLGREVSL